MITVEVRYDNNGMVYYGVIETDNGSTLDVTTDYDSHGEAQRAVYTLVSEVILAGGEDEYRATKRWCRENCVIKPKGRACINLCQTMLNAIMR